MSAFVGPGGGGGGVPPINVPPYPVAHPVNQAVRVVSYVPLVNGADTTFQVGLSGEVVWQVFGANPTAEPLWFQVYDQPAQPVTGDRPLMTHRVPRNESVLLPFMPGLLIQQGLWLAFSRSYETYQAGPTTPPGPFVSIGALTSSVP